MTSVSRTEIIEKTPDWIGTTFRETVEENGRGTELRGVVTDFVPDERMAFHLEGAFNTVDVVWTLKEKGQTAVYDQVEGASHAFFDWKPNDQVKATFAKYGVPYAAKMRAFFEKHLYQD